ncbi:MAG TPA: hypothetical protein VL993_13690 [Stellaceae bacterium]|nr:hypothetical protein [Stellaceae bacterium]
MWGKVMAAMAALALVGCQAPPPGTAAQPDPGTTLLAAIGEPFLIATKVPVCALTIIVAGPVGAAATLTDPSEPLGHDVKQGLADGINENCGPPWAVVP